MGQVLGWQRLVEAKWLWPFSGGSVIIASSALNHLKKAFYKCCMILLFSIIIISQTETFILTSNKVLMTGKLVLWSSPYTARLKAQVCENILFDLSRIILLPLNWTILQVTRRIPSFSYFWWDGHKCVNNWLILSLQLMKKENESFTRMGENKNYFCKMYWFHYECCFFIHFHCISPFSTYS